MASNSFGSLFRITTWGESHGPAVGVVIDGCPAGVTLSEEDLLTDLRRRAPGTSPYTSPRKEEDGPEILSGVFQGMTTGTPISILIKNRGADGSPYEAVKDLLKPGHAGFTYLAKYGLFDYRGGGRSSGRETVCRVAAGAVAKKILRSFSVEIIAYVKEIGGIAASPVEATDPETLKKRVETGALRCPDEAASALMTALLEETKEERDSLGGIVECICFGVPRGLGDPVYEKLQATLAKGILSIPAVKGIEFGSGFDACRMQGSFHNDAFDKDPSGRTFTRTNHAGGLLGGITTGMPLVFSAGFKPPSSIGKTQNTLSVEGIPTTFTLPPGSKHDPCIVPRAVPVVEAMTALCLVDALLLYQTSQFDNITCSGFGSG